MLHGKFQPWVLPNDITRDFGKGYNEPTAIQKW